MNNLSDEFDKLKISAFRKVKMIQPFVFNVTIGPNTTVGCTEEDFQNTLDTTDTPKTPENEFLIETSPVNCPKNVLLQKVIQNSENQRCIEVKEAVSIRAKLFEDFSKNQHAKFKSNWLKKQQELIERTQRQEQFMLQALEKYEQDASAHHQLLLQHHKQAEERIQKNLELQAQEEKRQQIKIIVDKISATQHQFRIVYEEIVALIRACSHPQELHKQLEEKSLKLKSLPESLAAVIEKCKTGQISDQEYQQSVNILNELSSFKELIKKSIEQIEKDELEKRDQERQRKELEEQKAQIASAQQVAVPVQQVAVPIQQAEKFLPLPAEVPNSPITETSGAAHTQLTAYISTASFKTYQELQGFAQQFQHKFRDIVQKPQLKAYRISLNKAINIPLNTIASQDPKNLLDKYERLKKIFRGRTVEVSDTQVNASEHPHGVMYCKDLLAKQFVLQGELTISSKPEAAFSYAAVIVALWKHLPDFGKLVLAHFHLQCPYLIPFYPPRTVDQSDEEFYRSQGYKYSDGVVEKQDLFLKRMTGITRLYAAIIVTELKVSQIGKIQPHGPNMGWRWLAAILNLEPRRDITATVLFTFLEVAGSTMGDMYGKQFYKIMLFMINEYMYKLQKIDAGGPVTRLEVMLQNFQRIGRFEPPKGKLPSGFW